MDVRVSPLLRRVGREIGRHIRKVVSPDDEANTQTANPKTQNPMSDSLKSINPYNGETVAEHERHSDHDVQLRLERGHDAYGSWRNTTMAERSQLMVKLGEVLKNEKDRLAEWATREMGKPIGQGVSEVEKCAWLCSHYAEHAEEYLSADRIDTDAKESYVAYAPLGVILGVMPWNFPYWQVMRFAVPTLMAGNTVVIKHASNTQQCAKEIAESFEKAGFPRGVFQVLAIGGKRVASVIENDIVRAVSVTGSETAGASVAEAAGRSLKKSVLELGGSNAFIVLRDADLDAAVDTAVFARVQNNGQSCIAAKRFLIETDVYDAFLHRFVEKWRALDVGDPMKPVTDVGPVAREDLAEKLENQMKASVSQGAELLMGGERDGAMFQPAILTGVRPGMPAFDEETFGPLAAIMRVSGVKEALELNNRSRYGLGATVCTTQVREAKELARQIDDGAVFINELVKSDPRLPFGGTKTSGYGRELGPLGIKEFVNAQTVYVK